MRLAVFSAIFSQLAACSSSSDEEPTTGIALKDGYRVAEGLFVINRADGEITQLAAVPSGGTNGGFIKFSYLDNGDGSFEFAYIPENDGDLYSFTAFFGEADILSSDPALRIRRSEQSYPNGPAYCRARHALGFGEVENTFVGLKVIDVDDFGQLDGVTVEEADAAGDLQTVQSDDRQISTDLVCANLERGLVYNHFDCQDSDSVNGCLSSGLGISEIRFKASGSSSEVPLTFPRDDDKILSSPGRPPNSPLGDNGPAVVVARDGSTHLMFERLYTTPEVFSGTPVLASEFSDGGFNALYYKHIQDDPSTAVEYEIDFRRWLERPAVHSSVPTSDIRIDAQRANWVEFTATAIFKAPSEASGYDEDVYVGILTGRFDTRMLDVSHEHKIVLDPAQVDGVVTFAEFTCRVWDRYGMAPDDNVYVYAVLTPYFLRDGRGREFIAFTTTKGLVGKLSDGVVTSPDGSAQPAEQLYESICGIAPSRTIRH